MIFACCNIKGAHAPFLAIFKFLDADQEMVRSRIDKNVNLCFCGKKQVTKMKKILIGFLVATSISVLIYVAVKPGESDPDPMSPQKTTSDIGDTSSQSQTGESHSATRQENVRDSNETIQTVNHQSLESAQEMLRSDPHFKNGLTERLFDFLEADQFAHELQFIDSRIPRNDGRVEILDEDGLVKATTYRSPQDEIELGYEEVNRLKEQVQRKELSINDLKALDAKGDPAASLELARIYFRSGNSAAAEQHIIRAAMLSGTPAPLSIAATDLYGMPSSNAGDRVLRAAWYLAAYAGGDYSVAIGLRNSLGNISTDLQDIAIDQALRILGELGG